MAPRAQVTAEQMYKNLAHASPEVIAHVQKASRDTVVDSTIQAPNTIQCEACSVSKATEQISRSTETEDLTNGLLFDRYGWDMGELTTAYNGDRYYSHLHCTTCGFIMINTHATKSEALKYIEYNVNFIRNVFGYTIRFMRLDGETSLQRAFNDFVRNIGIKPERSAPDTQEQNGGSERAGRKVVTKGRTMRVEANMPIDLWPEFIKTAGYLSNCTPVYSNF